MVVNKLYNYGGPYVVFEKEYLWKGLVKKDGVKI